VSGPSSPVVPEPFAEPRLRVIVGGRSGPASAGDDGDGRTVRGDDPMAADVEAARAGDQAAFARLVEATHRDTYSLALHLTRCAEDARDVTQEAYLRAYRNLDGFRGDARFSTWMYRITANVAMTQAGRSRRHRHDELHDDTPIVDPRSDHDPALVADAGDLRDRLLDALGRLPPKLRAVVVLRDVYELPHEDIAAELGISVTAAKVRLHRARHRLRADVFPELSEVPGRAL
jgi:RNA polymerase sigma-70 factor (ECF subfamily)